MSELNGEVLSRFTSGRVVAKGNIGLRLAVSLIFRRTLRWFERVLPSIDTSLIPMDSGTRPVLKVHFYVGVARNPLFPCLITSLPSSKHPDKI